MIITLREASTEISDLTPGQSYLVIGVEADDYRILNDHGQPYLYPHHLFEVLDPSEPADWVAERGEDHELYAYPPELCRVGFFEDFFDAQEEAMRMFWRVVNRRLTTAAA